MGDPHPSPVDHHKIRIGLLAFGGACLLMILACKILLISRYGSITPFWDQWNDEAILTYRNYLHSTLTLEHLVSSSNEHRLLLTRLLNIALLEVVGHWDPIVQMLVNAVLHIAALAVLIAMLVRGLPPLLATAFMAAVMFVFVIPFAWENTLWGFQSQFYFLLLMSLLALWTLVSAAAWSMRWWAGLVLGVLAYFGMASGALALFAAAATQVVQMLVRRRHAWGEAWAC